jgi:hypothetical protein
LYVLHRIADTELVYDVKDALQTLSDVVVRMSRNCSALQTLPVKAQSVDKAAMLRASLAKDSRALSQITTSLERRLFSSPVTPPGGKLMASPPIAPIDLSSSIGTIQSPLSTPSAIDSTRRAAGDVETEVQRLQRELADARSREGALMYQNQVLAARYAEAVGQLQAAATFPETLDQSARSISPNKFSCVNLFYSVLFCSVLFLRCAGFLSFFRTVRCIDYWQRKHAWKPNAESCDRAPLRPAILPLSRFSLCAEESCPAGPCFVILIRS